MFHYCRDIKRVPKNNLPQPSVSIAEKYNCEFCDKEWESESEVVLHKVAHSNTVCKLIKKGKFVCWTCVKTYTSKQELCKHIRTMHFLSSDTAMRVEREIFVCHDCERVFFNKQMLIIHIANDHNLKTESSEIHCPKCLKVRPLLRLKMHFYTHLMQSVLSCPICYHKCLNVTDFQTHITDKHPRHCYCNICDYSASTLEIFNKHCEQHQALSSKSSLPDDEDYISSFFVPTENQVWKYYRPMPYKGLRLQNELKICILCRAICESNEDMTEHLLRHTKLHEPVPQKTTYQCECGEIFNYRILLKQHKTNCKRQKNADTHSTEGFAVLSAGDVVRPIVKTTDPTELPFELGPEISLTVKGEEEMDVKKKVSNTIEVSGEVEITKMD